MKTLGLNSFIWIDKNAFEMGGDVKEYDFKSNQDTTTNAKHTKSFINS